MDDYEMTELAMRCVGMDTKDLDLAIYEHMDELDRRLDERWDIDVAMEFVERYGDVALWLDMEGRIRNANGWLDHGAVNAICEVAFGSA